MPVGGTAKEYYFNVGLALIAIGALMILLGYGNIVSNPFMINCPAITPQSNVCLGRLTAIQLLDHYWVGYLFASAGFEFVAIGVVLILRALLGHEGHDEEKQLIWESAHAKLRGKESSPN